MGKGHSGAFRRLTRAVLVAPVEPDLSRRPTLLETILPWPVRLFLVAGAAALGWQWSDSVLGLQLGGALHYVALVAVSVALSFWFWIFLVNLGFALAWLACPIARDKERPWTWTLHHALTFANRQIGHIEALAVWIVVALVMSDALVPQLTALTAVVLLGDPLLDGLGRWLFFPTQVAPEQLVRDLPWRRRPLLYAATLLGLLILGLLAPRQWLKLLPSALAISLADLVRTLRHLRWKRAMAQAQDHEHLDHFLSVQRRAGREADVLLGPALILAGLLGLLGASAWARNSYDNSLAAQSPSKAEPVDYCAADSPPAPAPDIRMFIVSDSQFHELRGRRFVGQMQFADALVPVALRPVELDILSLASLSHFATLYAQMARAPSGGGRLWWAHLGDMADLSCQGEMKRAGQLLRERYDPAGLAGVAPGNHDRAFTGNFFWSPYWSSACASGRLEKVDSDELLRQDWQGNVEAAHGRMLAIANTNLVARAIGRGAGLVAATPLGLVQEKDGKDGRRGVIGLFLDTADGQAFDLGAAGLFGTFSAQQRETLMQAIASIRQSEGEHYQDPAYLVFMHHPMDELGLFSHRRFAAWLRALDGDNARVLGIISAHTHVAEEHSHCVGQRMIPEIVVGSTIDPPQEAALLTLGPAADGVLSLRVQTVPAVARPGMTCGSPTLPAAPLTAAQCQTAIAGLRDDPDCAAMFRPASANARGLDCSVLEKTLTLHERLLQACTSGPTEEAQLEQEQRQRAQALLSCICRKDGDGRPRCAPGTAAADLDDQPIYDLLKREMLRSPDRETELTCLGWAAAAVQRYKSAGMVFADALRCAFDDEKLSAAHDYIAHLEATPCQ